MKTQRCTIRNGRYSKTEPSRFRKRRDFLNVCNISRNPSLLPPQQSHGLSWRRSPAILSDKFRNRRRARSSVDGANNKPESTLILCLAMTSNCFGPLSFYPLSFRVPLDATAERFSRKIILLSSCYRYLILESSLRIPGTSSRAFLHIFADVCLYLQ